MTTIHLIPRSFPTFRLFSQLFQTRHGLSQVCSLSTHRELKPQSFPSTEFDQIDSSVILEEETIPNYSPQKFYSVQIGDVFNQRYQTVGKLGYGASSTVWLCRDLMGHGYVTLKVYANISRANRELLIYKHLETKESKHAGRQCVRMLLDSFEVTGPHGKHTCLIHQPLGMSLYELKMRAKGKVFSKDVLRPAIRQLLAAVDYLHKEAHIIHTDLQPHNLLMGIDDKAVLYEYEKDELEYPVPRKVVDGRTIYLSRPLPFTFGPPVLCDLGEARLGDQEHDDDIMPDVYRAPEVIMGMKWGYKVDIWNVAMVVWDLFEPEYLFHARNSKGEYDNAHHIAQMIAVMGPPPPEFLKRSTNSIKYWDEDGNWRGLASIPEISLEKLEQRLTDDDKKAFLAFIKPMLSWMPEERPTAEEAIFDPWLLEDLYSAE
ncbi:hypothetical protein FQN49_004383 [Arthroderma sp. PD_2]|nr:hypothetical protein FQN49_004383 [Arthroderma sp. PD_2]